MVDSLARYFSGAIIWNWGALPGALNEVQYCAELPAPGQPPYQGIAFSGRDTQFPAESEVHGRFVSSSSLHPKPCPLSQPMRGQGAGELQSVIW